MAIDDTNKVDGLAIDKSRKALVLLMTDHLAFEGNNTLSEKDHLLLLQDKINAYIEFISTRQYESIYPNEEIALTIIEIHFKYNITKTCEKFIEVVRSQIAELGIIVETQVASESRNVSGNILF